MSKKYLHVQHTPKVEAQLPLAMPPLAVHSEGVKQVPSHLPILSFLETLLLSFVSISLASS